MHRGSRSVTTAGSRLSGGSFQEPGDVAGGACILKSFLIWH